MELVAFIGEDKENWGQVTALIKNGKWSKKILIKNSKVTNFPDIDGAEIISVDSTKPISEIEQFLVKNLSSKLSEFEAHLSIASGKGKEHIALISALLSIPLGIRLVAYTKNGVEIIN